MRKRTIFLLLLPILLVIWIVGWSFIWTGNQQQAYAQRRRQEDGIHVTVQLPEQQEQEIAD